MKGLLFIPELAIKACDSTKAQTRRALGLYPDHDLKDVATYYWHMVKCGYETGERRCLLAAWAVAPEFDHLKPTELNPNRVSGHFWHAGMGSKPDGFGKTRTGRFVPNVLRGLMMPMLDIQAVRIERVQDISEADAMAEGISEVLFRPGEGYPLCLGYMVGKDDGKTTLSVTAKDSFQKLWNSINAKRGFGWDANPVVAVINFQPLKEAAQ